MTLTLKTAPETERNTFLTLADAELIIEEIESSAADEWRATGFDEARKKRLLTSATRDISAHPWEGEVTSADQLQAWPRDGESTIPAEVERATVLQALFRLSGRYLDAEAQADGVSMISPGSGMTSFVGGRVLICREAMLELHPWRRHDEEIV